MTPSITVITPSFNQGKFIFKCIESVLFQEGDIHIKQIILDNCSTDDTNKITQIYDSRNADDVDIEFIRQKDEGVMDAWNKGLALVDSEYVAFCNTSDYYFNDRWFETCINIMKNNEWVNAVYGTTLIIDETNKFCGLGGGRVIGVLPEKQTPQDSFFAFMNDAITWNECTGVLRTEVLKKLAPFSITNPGAPLKAMRDFYIKGYLSYFVNSIGAVTLKHNDSKTAVQTDNKSMWDIHYKELQNFRLSLTQEKTYKYKNYKDTVIGELEIK